MRASTILILLSACADPVLHPGPCTASASASPSAPDSTYECSYAYERGLPVSATCERGHPIEPGTIDATWTYDGDVLIGFRHVSQSRNSTDRDITWDLGTSPPTRHEDGDDGGFFSWVLDDEYEAEGLVLVGQLFDLRNRPTTEDRRTRSHGVHDNSDNHSQSIVDTTYTYDSTTIPTDGARVRTSSDGQRVSFRYIDGHLVGGETYYYEWTGDRLTRLIPTNGQSETHYTYDDAGNLRESRDDTFVTTYDYGCWD